MPVELFAVLLGVASAISWGAGDFSGGLAAKKTAVFSVVVVFPPRDSIMTNCPIMY